MAVMLQEGFPTDDMIAYHEAKAKGGAALTIIEAARVHPSGNSGRPAIRAYDPRCVSGYKNWQPSAIIMTVLSLVSSHILAEK